MNPEIINREIGALIRKRRGHLSLTQEQLAGRVGISRASLANVEAGRQSVLVHQLYRLAGALELRPADLLPGADKKATSDKNLPLPDDLNAAQREQVAQLMGEGITTAKQIREKNNVS